MAFLDEIDLTFLLSHTHTSEVVPFLTVSATFIVCRAFISLLLGATVFALSVSRVCFLFLFIGETILSGFEIVV